MEGVELCPKCGNAPVTTSSAVAEKVDIKKSEGQEGGKPKHSKTKRRVVRLLSSLFALALIAGGAFIILFGSDSNVETDSNGYAPWVDLSQYYDLDKIVEEEDFAHFNSYELSSDRLALSRE